MGLLLAIGPEKLLVGLRIAIHLGRNSRWCRLRSSVSGFAALLVKRLVRELLADSELALSVERLMTIPAVGETMALTWTLEISIRNASAPTPRL